MQPYVIIKFSVGLYTIKSRPLGEVKDQYKLLVIEVWYVESYIGQEWASEDNIRDHYKEMFNLESKLT